MKTCSTIIKSLLFVAFSSSVMATTLPTGDSVGATYVGANSGYNGGSTVTVKIQGSVIQPDDLQVAAVSYEDMQASGTKLFDPTTIPFIDVEGNIASGSSASKGQISDSSVIVNGTINQSFKDWANKAWINGDSLVFYIKESGDKSFTDCKVANQTPPADTMIQSSNKSSG